MVMAVARAARSTNGGGMNDGKPDREWHHRQWEERHYGYNAYPRY